MESWEIAVGAPGWWTAPDPHWIGVISDRRGMVLDVIDRRIVADVPGVIRITEDERHALLLLVTETDITAVAATGVAWVSPRLAWDDLKVVAIDRRGIICTGYLGQSEVIVDPDTGRPLSGPVARSL